MKNLFLLFVLTSSTLLYSQTEFVNYKIKEGKLIWQKVYEEDLRIESQKIELRAVGLPTFTTTFWLTDIAGAKLKVQKKDGRTRLTVYDIYSISSTRLDMGMVEENVTPTYAGEIYISKKKGVFKNLFLKKDGRLIHKIIESKIEELLEGEDDDW